MLPIQGFIRMEWSRRAWRERYRRFDLYFRRFLIACYLFGYRVNGGRRGDWFDDMLLWQGFAHLERISWHRAWQFAGQLKVRNDEKTDE